MTMNLSARQIRHCLLAVALILAVLSLGVRLIPPGAAGMSRLFDLEAEMSYPNWYSSLGMAVASLLLGATAWVRLHSNRREFLAHWIFLSATFGFLSSDEIVCLHEAAGGVVRRLGGFTGYFRFAWVIPAGVGLCIFGLAYLRFLAALPVRRRNQFVAAGAIYVLGALVMEMIGAKFFELYSRNSMSFVLCYHLEELLELCGIALFNAALIEHLAGLLGPDGLRIRFSAE